MRIFLALCLLLMVGTVYAQKAKVNELPEFVYIPPAPEKYVWEQVAQVRHRILFNNTIACSDSVVYSFGGFNTLRVQREMNRLEGKRFIKDTLQYPGRGFKSNVFFIRDSLMYLGGGHDSGASRYVWNDFWRYNLRTHAWKQLQDLPFYYARAPSIFTWDKRVFLLIAQLHGEDFREAAPLFYEYDDVRDKWTVISKVLPAAVMLPDTTRIIASSLTPVAFKVDDQVFVLFQRACGMVGVGCSHMFFKFSLRDREWTKLPHFPGWLESNAFAVSDDIYGYIGGGVANSMANRREVYRYDPQQAKWARITNMPRGVRYAKGWRFQGETYVGFGINDKDGTVTVWKLTQKK